MALTTGCGDTSNSPVTVSPQNTASAANNTPVQNTPFLWQKQDSFMMRMEKEALKEPYRGIFSNDEPYNDLFPLKKTGVSTKPVVAAAHSFLSTLKPEQKSNTVFDVQSDQWRMWSNVDNGIYLRQGISIGEMTKNQRLAAFELLQASLSAKGLQFSKDIMKTDQTLRELNNGNPIYDEELYYLTVMGEPSLIEPWGWQLDGHHLIINYFVLKDQVVMSPVFMGAEPVFTTTGKYQGNTLFQDEQNLGLKLMQSLPAEQQQQATLAIQKARHDALTEAFKDNTTLSYEGLKCADLSADHKSELLVLIEQYIRALLKIPHFSFKIF